MSWPNRSLAEVAPIRSRKPEFFDGARRYYSTGAVGKSGELDSPELVTFAERPSRANSMPRIGDVGFARMNGTQKVVLISEAELGSLFSTGFCFLEPNDSIDSKYLFYFLTSEGFQSEKNALAGEGIMGGIKNSDVANMQIPLPPLPEQQRIARLLDEAFEGITVVKANAEKNLQNARTLFESHLQAVFTQADNNWVEAQLNQLVEIKHGYAFDGAYFSEEGEFVLLTPGNFFERGGYRDRGDKQKYFVGEIPRDYVLSAGDLLVAMTEQAVGLLGSPILVPDSAHFLHNQRLGLVSLKANVKILNEFLFYAFNTKGFRKAIQSSASGVKVRHTSPNKIGIVRIMFPESLLEQQRIASLLSSLNQETEHLRTLYERKLFAQSALVGALLSQAFSGGQTAA